LLTNAKEQHFYDIHVSTSMVSAVLV